MAVIVERIGLPQVIAAAPPIIFVAMHTCWWTHDRRHICINPKSRLPCDPRGSVLMEMPPEPFFEAVQAHPEHYGKHGIRALMAAHHLNCQTTADDPRPTSLETWEEVNAALDELDTREV
jgi:hypothetical protein